MRAGVMVALAVGVIGWGVERARFGRSDDDALARVERELRDRVDATAETLGGVAARVAGARATIESAARDPGAQRILFDVVAGALPPEGGANPGITVYDADGGPVAWAGRVTDLPKERIDTKAVTASLFVAPSALGPRLVRVETIPGVAAIVVEQSLGTTPAAPGPSDTLVVPTSLIPVTVRAQIPPTDRPADRPHHAFVVSSRDGGTLLEAEVMPSDLAAARDRWEHIVGAVSIAVLAATLLLCMGALLEWRARAHRTRPFVVATAALLATVVVAWAVLRIAIGWLVPGASLAAPLPFLTTALAAAGIVWVAIDAIERRRLAPPRPRLLGSTAQSIAIVISVYGLAGAAAVGVVWTYERALQRLVSQTTLDLLHFSLHPVNAGRLAITCGLVLFHAAVVWTAAAIALAPEVVWRTRRATESRAAVAGSWLIGVIVAIALVRPSASQVPLVPAAVAVLVAGASAVTVTGIRSRFRRASQSARIFTVFLALLVPAIAMYPSVLGFAIDAKERLVATEYGPQAASQREDLEQRVRNSLAEIDAGPSLKEFVAGVDVPTPTTDRAFVAWSRTDLATYRLTSALELFNAQGRPVSRFALSLPEYSTSAYRATGCAWEPLVDEVSPLGSIERHVLRTSRGICDRGRILGGIVVRAMLDPRTLPFISSQSPYLQSLRLGRPSPSEGVFGRDIEFAMYGWSRAPIYAFGTSVWPLRDADFQRMVDSRDRFWTTIDRDEETFRVYLQNDRYGIYALAYPVITWLGHLINLSELVLLAGMLYLVLLVVSSLFSSIALRTPASGRALLHEIRSSFYLKLFFAFVAAVVVPVAILAIATRTYFANQLLASADETAARTVTTAQRLVEDYATLQQRGASALTAIDDQIMVLVRRAIDEDVNLFDRNRLQATSARDLFASRLLSMRTPGDVYRSVVLDRLPTFVGDEQIGAVPFRLAAAPVTAGGREGVVTVALTTKQLDIEQQIDELDRRVLSGALLFSLLGAALGYWMAERIADPVNRLTRATRRIARGDLDARIAATSSDELRRLVEDFNQMAADLKRQRTELERTQRLEAWADMARQVAHDIKNPLTPIQLSAEHARRVNVDRGRPLSPVLDECVDAILTQVKLLRQISAEFSSFASSPTARPEPTTLPALIEEVVEPYRTGLAGRIDIRVDAASDLPPVTIDRTLFARALTNIIENALHAMPGQGRLTIAARVDLVADVAQVASGASTVREPRISGTAVVVEITDTGVGMDPESASKIFEPYFSTKATGTGLGLTIAKRNVELNGGTIEVRSQRGIGTTVTILLPVT
jgi:signal transduction histidine kinase